MEVYIRELTPADIALADDFFRLLAPEGNMFYNCMHGNEKNLRRQLEEPASSRVDFGAMEKSPDGSERMIGHVFLGSMDTKLPWLGICLREGATGKHLGRRLLQYLQDYCLAHDCGGMILTTHAANIRAQILYRNFGFLYLGIHTSGEFIFYKPFPRKR